MKKSIVELFCEHPAETIYVIGSGPSMNFIDPSFFEDKLVICVNDTWRKFKADYVVQKESSRADGFHRFGESAISAGKTLVVSEHCCGTLSRPKADYSGDFYYFRHFNNDLTQFNLSALDLQDHLVVSYSTMTSAIHFAHFLGAKNIVIAGHDCGMLDGLANYHGYESDESPDRRSCNNDYYVKFEAQTIELVNELRKRGTNVFSLNPFINLNLEGHKYHKN